MPGIFAMDNVGHYNRKIVAGCAFIVLLASLAAVALLGSYVSRERKLAQYPGSVALTGHSNYSSLPSQFRWDNSYRTTDPFPTVYEWYSTKFELGAESRALGDCILLDGTTTVFVVERYTSVFLCDTPGGRLIYVTRSTAFRR